MADVAENLALGERLLDYADALEAAWFTAEVEERFNTWNHGSTRGTTADHAPGSAITFDTTYPPNN